MINIDSNYNIIVTTDNNKQYLMYANRLNNEDLDHWQGWSCAAGFDTVLIDQNSDVYVGECKNEYLGNLLQTFELPSSYTVCKKTRCTGDTNSLMATKFQNTA